MWFEMLDPRMTPEYLGYIPYFLSEEDERPAREQFDTNYAHGGGWRPFQGFEFNKEKLTIKYPGDPAFRALARTQLRDETILIFDCAWVMILQKDGSYEISRMD